jgi:putative SOS response-associated peptidase YedK
MITCDPTGHSFSGIHDRMPIIMNKAERRLWMSPEATEERLLALLKPCNESMYNTIEAARQQLKTNRRNMNGGTNLDLFC